MIVNATDMSSNAYVSAECEATDEPATELVGG